jgi:hypothetical protein
MLTSPLLASEEGHACYPELQHWHLISESESGEQMG